MSFFVSPDWLEVIAGVVIMTVVGSIWYSPLVLSDYWMKVKGILLKMTCKTLVHLWLCL